MAEDAQRDVDSDSLDLDALADLDMGDAKLAKSDKKKAKSKPDANAPHMALRVVLGVSGLLLIVGFFLDWLILPQTTVSGIQLVTSETEAIQRLVPDETMRWLLLAVPGFGAALTAVGFLGLRWSGPIAAILGVLIVLYGLITFIIIFFQSTGVGLWLVLGGAFTAIFAGALTWARSRNARPDKKLEA